MLQVNRILATDSYKTSHAVQYPPGTTKIYSYFEARGGEFDAVTFLGIQEIVKKYLTSPVAAEEVEYGCSRVAGHMGPAIAAKLRARWMMMVERYGGKFPLSIKAVPEGTTVNHKNVLMTVENTDPDFFWLTSYVEALLVRVWYPTSVCTHSREMKKLILKALHETGTPELIDFKLHDFGDRGVSSGESAGTGALAHLVNFKGTDTMRGIEDAREYYSCDMAGFSIPAAEHSTITSWGQEHEVDAFRNMLEQFPDSPVAIVIDSYDDENACKNLIGGVLREAILSRKPEHFVVARPDSGEPNLKIIQVLNWLGEKFGTTTNAKGYKVLPPQIRVIYGDGIDLQEMKRICYSMKSDRWSMDNTAFGEGGGLLQKVNRDTHKFAYKCSHIVVNGVSRDVFKAPRGDTGKASKKGRLKLVLDHAWKDKVVGPVLVTVPEAAPGQDVLREIYRNGVLLVDETLDTIRERARL